MREGGLTLHQSALTHAQGASVQGSAGLIITRQGGLKLKFTDFHTGNVYLLHSSQVISLISTTRAFILLASDHVLFVRSISVRLNLSWPTTVSVLAQIKHGLCWLTGLSLMYSIHILFCNQREQQWLQCLESRLRVGLWDIIDGPCFVWVFFFSFFKVLQQSHTLHSYECSESCVFPGVFGISLPVKCWMNLPFMFTSLGKMSGKEKWHHPVNQTTS